MCIYLSRRFSVPTYPGHVELVSPARHRDCSTSRLARAGEAEDVDNELDQKGGDEKNRHFFLNHHASTLVLTLNSALLFIDCSCGSPILLFEVVITVIHNRVMHFFLLLISVYMLLTGCTR